MRSFVALGSRVAAVSAGLLFLACSGSSSSDDIGASESAQISDASSITRRPDGLFDVVCRDGRREVANEAELLANTVCAPLASGGSTSDAGTSVSDGGTTASDAGTSTTDAGAGPLEDGKTCATAFRLGSVSGDRGSDIVTTSGTTSQWVLVEVHENATADAAIKFRATLTSPSGSNFDLYLHAAYGNPCRIAPTTKSTSTSATDTAGITTFDLAGSDDGYYVAVEVRRVSGLSLFSPWTLRLEGNK